MKKTLFFLLELQGRMVLFGFGAKTSRYTQVTPKLWAYYYSKKVCDPYESYEEKLQQNI